jgi:hypothetical protein
MRALDSTCCATSAAPLMSILRLLSARNSFLQISKLSRAQSRFTNALSHHRRHVHHSIVIDDVQNLLAVASFYAFSVVPAKGYFDWGVWVEWQNSIRHCCSPSSSVPVQAPLR